MSGAQCQSTKLEAYVYLVVSIFTSYMMKVKPYLRSITVKSELDYPLFLTVLEIVFKTNSLKFSAKTRFFRKRDLISISS